MAKKLFVEAASAVDDGLAAVPNQPDLLRLAKAAQSEFVTATTSDTSSALAAATDDHAGVQAGARSLEAAAKAARTGHASAATA